MLARASGTIVFVSSMGGRIPISHEAAYNAAKFAVCGFAEAMYLDLFGSGVDTKLVLPGPIDTEIWDQPGNLPALFEIDKVPADECAEGIADALASDAFEHYVPALLPGGIDAKQLAVGAHEDCDGTLRAMAEFTRALGG
jgi:short-subunit dehydrogenase